MSVYVGMLLALLGVLAIVAGVQGRGTQLFTTATGVGAGSGGGATTNGAAATGPAFGSIPGTVTA